MSTTNINFRIDEELKKQAEAILDELGMDISTAFTMFAETVVKTGKIPPELMDDFGRLQDEAVYNSI